MKTLLTVNSKKATEHHDVVRGDSHKRIRPSVFGKKGCQRLNTLMTPKSLDIHLVQSFGQYNFFSILWLKKNKYVFPTFNEIMKGLIEEAKEQIRLTSGLQSAIARSVFSSMNASSPMSKLLEGQKNISDSWLEIFNLIPFYQKKKERKNIFASFETKIIQINKDEPIAENKYSNPNSAIVKFILYIFSMETFLKDEILRAQSIGEIQKSETLGPYTLVLNQIFAASPRNRKDIDVRKYSIPGVDLYRAGSLTDSQINEYENLIGQKREGTLNGKPLNGETNFLSAFGYVSCTLNPALAATFAYSDKAEGKKPVIFIIQMSATHNYYNMSNGAYQHEEEVVLVDGSRFIVLSISDSSS